MAPHQLLSGRAPEGRVERRTITPCPLFRGCLGGLCGGVVV